MTEVAEKNLDVVNKVEPVRWTTEIKECGYIAHKFNSELDALLKRYFRTEEIQPLKQRLHKAVHYFATRIVKNLIEPITEYYDEIAYISGSKGHQRNTLSLIQSLWNLIEGMTEAELKDEKIYQGESIKRPPRLTKAVKRKKKSFQESTYDITLSLHERGLPKEDIASMRQLTENTIYSHFVRLYKEDKVPITELIDKDKLAKLLKHFPNVSSETTLTEIKTCIPFTTTYQEIKAAKAYFLKEK